MITWTNIYVSVFATLCFIPCMVFAQPTTKKRDYDSALEARRIVERAIVAMGEQAAIDAVQDILRTLTGTRAGSVAGIVSPV